MAGGHRVGEQDESEVRLGQQADLRTESRERPAVLDEPLTLPVAHEPSHAVSNVGTDWNLRGPRRRQRFATDQRATVDQTVAEQQPKP